jgi:hypothetical protein
MNFIEFLIENVDYRGEHEAPDKESGAPLYDLTVLFPEDVYGYDATRMYGAGESYDGSTIGIIQSYRNKPNATIKIYRAVPHIKTNAELIQQYEKEKAQMRKSGRLPAYVDLSKYKNRYAYYDHISDEIERLQHIPDTGKQKITINPGDWVAITKQYAIDHGRSHLNNQYKILTKTVYARDLFTDGDIHEWGYDPQPRVSTRITK